MSYAVLARRQGDEVVVRKHVAQAELVDDDALGTTR